MKRFYKIVILTGLVINLNSCIKKRTCSCEYYFHGSGKTEHSSYVLQTKTTKKRGTQEYKQVNGSYTIGQTAEEMQVNCNLTK